MREFTPEHVGYAKYRCGRLAYTTLQLSHPEPLNIIIPVIVPHAPPAGSWAEAAVLLGWDGNDG